MSQFPAPFVWTLPQYTESQCTAEPMMASNSPPETSRTSLQQKTHLPHAAPKRKTKTSHAKRGKRVHACGLPGCSKIFTRAEHQRRHQLSHHGIKPFACSYAGCKEIFSGADSLNKHRAGHNLDDVQSTAPSVQNSVSLALLDRSPSQCYRKTELNMEFQSKISGAGDQIVMNGEQPPVVYSNCDDYQGGLQAFHAQSVPLCSNASGPSIGYFGPQPSRVGVDTELEALFDQYMRSVLRPEVFLPAYSQYSIMDPNTLSMASSADVSTSQFP